MTVPKAGKYQINCNIIYAQFLHFGSSEIIKLNIEYLNEL